MRKIVFMLLGLMLTSALAFSQAKLISGRITDQAGLAVPFATVHLKGTKLGVAADADGNFSIKAREGDVLVISGTGITNKEIPVAGSSLVIQVSRKESSLTEVVVTALGIKRESKALGYSTATVNAEALNVSKPINAAQGLIGQVSGAQVSIINNGVDPQIRVQLRGERHIIADNQPLFIVDGMEASSR
jgi:hypothetical protein